MSQNMRQTPINAVPVHCWPLDVQGHHFALGHTMDCSAAVSRAFARERQEPRPGVGTWECEIRGDALTWSDEVYDIFGLPRGAPVTRAEAVTYYRDHSRALMERLRANAIEHKQSFVLDAEMRPGHGAEHIWMRIVAVPVCENGEVVRLQGFKQRI